MMWDKPNIVTVDFSKPITIKEIHEYIQELHEQDKKRRVMHCGPMQINLDELDLGNTAYLVGPDGQAVKFEPAPHQSTQP